MARNVPTDPEKDSPEAPNVEIAPDVVVVDGTVSEPTEEVVAYDQGGVYVPHNVGIITAPVGSPSAQSKTADNRIVFSNTRSPEAKIAVVEDGKRTGRWLKFNSGKLVVDDPADAEKLERLKIAGVYREPGGFFSAPEDKFFVHKDTGFKTLSKDAYEDWVNHSEWSATPGR